MNHQRHDFELPDATEHWGWRYHHIGIPTLTVMPEERYLPQFKFYISGFSTSPYGIEWMRFDDDSPMHPLIKTVPHIAFEVDDLDYELTKRELNVITHPNPPSDGVRVAMIEHNDAPIELIEFACNKEKLLRQLQYFIPKSKHDTDLIDELACHNYPFYRPILNDLFEWIQDINWPVAQKIVPLLAHAGTDVIPYVRKILATDDTMWMYWTLEILLHHFHPDDTRNIVTELHVELLQKHTSPTSNEHQDEVDLQAGELLRHYAPVIKDIK